MSLTPNHRQNRYSIMLQGNKELLPFDEGRMKEDYRADTIDECGSRAGPRSRNRNSIPLRPSFREASKD